MIESAWLSFINEADCPSLPAAAQGIIGPCVASCPCTTWTTRAGNRNVVFVGSTTVPSSYRLTSNPRYPNAIADYRAQFAKLKTLGCDVFLASHGNFFGLADIIAKKKSLAGYDEYRAFVGDSERRFEERVAKGE